MNPLVEITVEKAGELFLDLAVRKISEYKDKNAWEKLLINTNEFLLKEVDRGDELLKEIATYLSGDEIKQIASNLTKESKYDLRYKLHDELSRLMMKYEIPRNVANYYISNFIIVVFSELEKTNPSYYKDAYLGDWRKKEENSLEEIKEELTKINNAIIKLDKNDIAVYSPERLEVCLYTSTNPGLSLDYFEIDDEVFREEFEDALSEEIIYVKGQCKEEAIYCVLNELRRICRDKMVLVVRNEKDWNRLKKANEENDDLGGKILIPWFYSNQIIAIPNNTNIFIFGSDDCLTGKQALKLRKRKLCTVRQKLIDAGMDYKTAYKMIEDTHGLFIPIKKKIIKGIDNIAPLWLKGDKKIILPLILCGKWTESDGDKMIIEDLCDLNYQEILQSIQEYINGENPLFVRFKEHGTYYIHLASTELAWEYYDQYIITDSNLWEKYVAVIMAIITEENPIYKFPMEKQSYANLLPGGNPCWSKTLKEGLLRSLVMKAYYCNKPENQREIDEIVANILSNITEKNQWLSIATLFPILCEASPYAVTTRLDEEWERETGLKELFLDAHDTSVFAKNEYTYFLWGIEQFFCQKEYAAWSVRWLLRMNELRRKYPISNSPYETLSIVFCAWYNNTILTQQEKLFLAREAFDKGYKVWDLFYSEMPGMKTSVSVSISKPKYRITSDPVELTNKDVYDAFEEYTSLCLKHMNFNVERWIKVVKQINHFSDDMTNKIIDRLVYEVQSMNDIEKTNIKEALRKVIYKNRYFNSSEWAMKEDRLNILEKTLNDIRMEDSVYEYRYLFGNKYDFPLLHPHPYSEDERREKNEQLIEEEITNGLLEFKEYKLNVLDLARICSECDYSILGKYLFSVFSQKDFDEKLFFELLEDEKLKRIMLNYIQEVYYYSQKDYKRAYQLAKQREVSSEILVSILLMESFDAEKKPLIMNEDENIKKLYWNQFKRGMFVENERTAHLVMEEMLKFSTHLSIIDVLDDCKKFFTAEELLTILEKIKNYEAGNFTQLSDYHISNILSVLQKKYYSTDECIRVACLELSYRGIIDTGKMKCLNKSLRDDPSLYLGMLSVIFKDDEGNSVSGIQLNDKNISSIYSLYYDIKFCPAEEDGMVDAEKLERWVTDFEKGLIKNKQHRLFEGALGRLFAFSPRGRDGYYPSEEVRTIIEGHYNKSLEYEYVTAIYNARGVFSSSGGAEERRLAHLYRDNANAIRILSPNTAKLYDQLYERYIYDANAAREGDEYARV